MSLTLSQAGVVARTLPSAANGLSNKISTIRFESFAFPIPNC